MTDSPILVEQRGALGRITLNAPKALNSLSLAMTRAIRAQLDAWATDDGIAAVWLDGAGDKAFCAGGDIRALYDAMIARAPGDYVPEAAEFFTDEYRTDYAIHTYPKPIIVWGSGIVMGGGIGLLCGASHRVVTDTSRLAMPEITIGLYPDVAGSWFLNRLPDGIGLFLGLTGAQINATDALELGFADRFAASDARDALIDELAAADFSGDATATVNTILRRAELAAAEHKPIGHVTAHGDTIRTLTDHDALADTVAAITGLDTDDDWLARAAKTLGRGCPMTAHLVDQQIRRSRHLGLADVFRQELIMSTRCAMEPDFREGVRALLIDKDGTPNWAHASPAAVPADAIERHFQPPWDGDHPLQDLGH